jgi:putative flippase GtrA
MAAEDIPYTARVAFVEAVLRRLPAPLRNRLIHHRELLKFAIVGGTAFVVDTAIFLGLKDTVLESKPVTAKVISSLVATILSYYLNREWSFRTRGGRRRHHEMWMFFVVSGIGWVLTSVPLWLSRYGLHLETPYVSRLAQEVADFVSAQIVGTLVAMAFRWWAFRRFVFPHADARTRDKPAPGAPTNGAAAAEAGLAQAGAVPAGAMAAAPPMHGVDEAAADILGDPWAFDEPDDFLDADTDELSSRH